jgi:LysR family transcriptional regulator, nod-box dependent transcriptional activator
MKNKKNIRLVNLNTLPILREILRHGSLTKAAKILNLSQPALSSTLKQLRIEFNDDLIRPVGRKMELTQKGEQLLEQLDQFLNLAEDLVSGQSFIPIESNDIFRIATTDHVMASFAPKLAQIMAQQAPNMRVHLQLMQRQSVADLMSGTIEMTIVPKATLGAGGTESATLRDICFETLMSETLVCIGHIDDRELAAGLSVAQYLARPHIGFFLDPLMHLSVEQAYLAGVGMSQFDRMLATSYAIIPSVVAASHSLAIVPESLALSSKDIYPLQIVPSPVPYPPLEQIMVWHRRNDDNPAIGWLRSKLQQSVEGLSGSQ